MDSDIKHSVGYEHDNYSGDTGVLTIGLDSFTVQGTDLNGKYKLLDDNYCEIEVYDGKHLIEKTIAYSFEDSSDWVVTIDGMSRMSANPIIAALKVIHNIY